MLLIVVMAAVAAADDDGDGYAQSVATAMLPTTMG